MVTQETINFITFYHRIINEKPVNPINYSVLGLVFERRKRIVKDLLAGKIDLPEYRKLWEATEVDIQWRSHCFFCSSLRSLEECLRVVIKKRTQAHAITIEEGQKAELLKSLSEVIFHSIFVTDDGVAIPFTGICKIPFVFSIILRLRSGWKSWVLNTLFNINPNLLTPTGNEIEYWKLLQENGY